MSETTMTSMERVLCALSHREPDRVPLFLFFTTHGSKELGLPIKEYFSSAKNVAEGQFRLLEKYGHDCLNGILHVPLELQAWGGEVVFFDDGPPNTGIPPFKSISDILSFGAPKVSESPGLQVPLEAIRLMKERDGGKTPIIGVTTSPFSLPAVQLGVGAYIEALYDQRDEVEQLLRLNEEFCVEWANAQLDAGATAIAYFDPISSPTIVPRDMFLWSGFEAAKRTISRIKGPVAFHFASAACLPIMEEVAASGAAIVGASSDEDIALVKAAAGKMTVLGNLNGVEMRKWTPAQAEEHTRIAIRKAGAGGGLILADNHGEVPWAVPDEVLHAIVGAVKKWGSYPLNLD